MINWLIKDEQAWEQIQNAPDSRIGEIETQPHIQSNLVSKIINKIFSKQGLIFEEGKRQEELLCRRSSW